MGFGPLWYNRNSGWNGQTYKEAVTFCMSQTNEDGYQMTLCPYEAYCPLGDGSIPFGGIKVEQDSESGVLAPIANMDNDWVYLNNEKPCALYSTLYPDLPAWGITGQNNEERTRNVLCCRTSSKGENVSGGDAAPAPVPAETSQTNAQPTDQAAYQTAKMSMELKRVFEQIDPKYEPVGFGRYQGWMGSTFSDATEFCRSSTGATHVPCSFKALCPNGIGGQPYSDGGIEDIYAPIQDSVDTWIELREGGYCEEHTSLQEYQDVTRYMLCCKSEASSSSESQPPLDAIYETIGGKYKPVGYDRKDWKTDLSSKH